MLVSLRLAPLFLFAPVFGSMSLPAHFRVFFVLALSYLLTAALGLDVGAVPIEPIAIVRAVVGELIIGTAIAAGVIMGFAAFSFAGRMLDLQIGFGVASLLDLNTRAATPLIGTALSMMAVTMFYLVDGHHMLLRGVAYSFERLPLAQGIGGLDIGFLVAFAGSLFSFGLVLIAPIVLMLFLIDVGLAVMSRTMPQMNVFVLGISIKVFVGMLLLAVSVRYMGGVASKVFESVYQYLDLVVS
jgi:flagellar biosynthesis protein FliR